MIKTSVPLLYTAYSTPATVFLLTCVSPRPAVPSWFLEDVTLSLPKGQPKTPPGALCLQHSSGCPGGLLPEQPGLHSQAVRFATKKDGNEKLPLYLVPLWASGDEKKQYINAIIYIIDTNHIYKIIN